jgi:Ca2+-binding RTX toxin-like protein
MADETGAKRNDDISVFFGGTVNALGGNDSIFYSQGGNFNIFGGDGNDRVTYGTDAVILSISGFIASPATGTTAAANDLINLGSGNDIVDAGGGNDSLSGGKGFDIISYNVSGFLNGSGFLEGFHFGGKTTIIANKGVRVDLEAGTSSFSGANITVEVHGSNGAAIASASRNNFGAFTHSLSGFEAVIGSKWGDVLSGTDRTDIIEVFDAGQLAIGSSTGKVIGRGGIDVASYAWMPGAIFGNLAKRTVETVGILVNTNGDRSDFTDVLSGVEGLYGSHFNDTLKGDKGDKGDNIFNGRGGNDRINGGGGFDTVCYNTGQLGKTGTFFYDAVAFLADGTFGVVVDLGDETATDDFGDTDTLVNIEEVIGSLGNDKITGDKKNNTLRGDQGDDTLLGDKGKDFLFGGEGDDTINGGDGNDIIDGDRDGTSPFARVAGRDVLNGGGGNDIIFGGGNDDSLNGGGGNDTLDGGDGNDKLFCGAGKDVFVFGKGTTTAADFTIIDDMIDVRGRFTSLEDVKSAVTNTSGRTLTIVDDGDTLILSNTDIDQIQERNFIF